MGALRSKQNSISLANIEVDRRSRVSEDMIWICEGFWVVVFQVS
jgi:hypothetical protein